MPTVDGGVELHARVCTLPGGLGELAHQVTGPHGLDDAAVGHGPQVPVGVVHDGLHELVGDPNRVVGVLVLHRVAVGAVEVHVEPGVAQHTCLALLNGLAPDELLHVGVIDVEDDHLGGPAGLATRLDGARRGVGASHEAHRTRGGAAALEQFLGRADPRQVHPGARTALEDDTFLPVPVEDGVHGVVHREDETGAGLLGDTGDPDVEPHRRVECGALGDDEELHLVTERLGFGLVHEVAVTDTPLGDGVGDAVGDLLQRPLALGGAGGATEVLLGDDVGGVERPVDGELHAELFERHRTVAIVADPGVTSLPLDLVVGVDTSGGEVTADADTCSFGSEGHDVSSGCELRLFGS